MTRIAQPDVGAHLPSNDGGDGSRAKVFTSVDPWPDFGPGTVVAVNYGDYRGQEIWVACGANVGNWYPLGSPFGNYALKDPSVPRHPTWEDVVARGPVTLLVPATNDAYAAGWAAGRRRLLEQVEQLRDDEDVPPGTGWRASRA